MIMIYTAYSMIGKLSSSILFQGSTVLHAMTSDDHIHTSEVSSGNYL